MSGIYKENINIILRVSRLGRPVFFILKESSPFGEPLD